MSDDAPLLVDESVGEGIAASLLTAAAALSAKGDTIRAEGMARAAWRRHQRGRRAVSDEAPYTESDAIAALERAFGAEVVGVTLKTDGCDEVAS